MVGTGRNRAEREVILHPLAKPLSSLEELSEACLPTLTARLWATCCWSATMDSGWKIGDHNFLIAEVYPDPETCLYVQLWSEPHERVCAEVSSGEWNPGAVKYVRQPQRDRIEALGYAVGGRAGNFRKELQVATSAEAETAAREVLGIFFDVFGYRGQWPLELKLHQGERAAHAPVYSSLTPADFARLAAHLGLERGAFGVSRPILPLRRGKKQFLASFGGRASDGSLYSTVVLQASLASPRAIDHAVVERIADTLLFARLSRAPAGTLSLHMPLRLDGGVTVTWLTNGLRLWFSEWRACERLLKKARRPRATRPTRGLGTTVH